MARSKGLVAFVALALAGAAHAQDGEEPTEGFDAHGLALVAQDGDPRDLLRVHRAGRFEQGDFWATGLFEYADEPLVLGYHYTDGRPDEYEPYLDNVMALNFNLGGAVHDRVRLDLGVPLYLASVGPGGGSQGVAIGDIRFTPTAAIVRPKPQYGGGFGLAVMPYIDLPTGDPDKFLGDQGVSYGGFVAATYEAGPLTLSLDAGPEINPNIDVLNQTGADHVSVGGGVGFLVTRTMGINLEGRKRFALGGVEGEAFKGIEAPAEFTGSFRGRLPSGPHFALGAATALSRGAGAAKFRAFVAVGFGKVNMNYGDWDGDGIGDEADQCLKEPETLNSYQDDDGCPDAGGTALFTVQLDGFVETDVPITVTNGADEWTLDSALEPVPLELAEGTYRVKAGYPGYVAEDQFVITEGEQSVVLDLEEVVPGTLSISLEHAHGDSLDKVGLSVIGEGAPPGSQTLGPNGLAHMELPPGQYLVYLKTNDGALYRKYISITSDEHVHIDASLRNPRVKLTATRVEVDETIYFDTDKATIKPESHDLLEEIGTLLIANPQVTKIEIQGHTDDQGSEEHNLELSQSRADAVKEFMVDLGVEADRLESVGYGESYPISTNATEAGRARNRRVEFLILEQE